MAYYLNKHGEDILNSCVLVEEDASFLENFFMQTLKYPKQRGHIRFLNLKW